MTVDVPCASTLPALSETLASHLPVSARIGREKLPFVSMVAWTFPGAVDQRQRPSAMHAPQRIQQMRPRLALEHGEAFAHFGQTKGQLQICGRRQTGEDCPFRPQFGKLRARSSGSVSDRPPLLC